MRVGKKEGFPRLALNAHHYHDGFSLLYRNIHAAFKPFLPQETHKDYKVLTLPMRSDLSNNEQEYNFWLDSELDEKLKGNKP